MNETRDRSAMAEIPFRIGADATCVDGVCGKVSRVVVDPVARAVIEPGNHHVSHVLLQEGHVFGRRQVVVPIGAVTEVINGVQLNLTMQQVENLPPVNIDHPSG